jgi:hypothetical protein
VGYILTDKVAENYKTESGQKSLQLTVLLAVIP